MKKIIITMSLVLSATSQAKTVRATELNTNFWQELKKNPIETVVEFHEGDELPVSFTAEGDFFETSGANSFSYVTVKRNFWLKMDKSGVKLSLDGVTYKSISETISGAFEAGAGASASGTAASSINLMFKANIK